MMMDHLIRYLTEPRLTWNRRLAKICADCINYCSPMNSRHSSNHRLLTQAIMLATCCLFTSSSIDLSHKYVTQTYGRNSLPTSSLPDLPPSFLGSTKAYPWNLGEFFQLL